MSEKNLSRYMEIAIDISKRIKRRELKEGQKLRGRSLSSSDYNVSSETMRKTFNLLQEYGVIEVKEKSGAIILSRDNAIEFLDTFSSKKKFMSDLEKIYDLQQENAQVEHKIKSAIKKLESYAPLIHSDFPIDYVTVQLHDGFSCIGQRVQDVPFNAVSGCTLFGIISRQAVHSTIDPEYRFVSGDTLYFSGNTESTQKLLDFIKK